MTDEEEKQLTEFISSHTARGSVLLEERSAELEAMQAHVLSLSGILGSDGETVVKSFVNRARLALAEIELLSLSVIATAVSQSGNAEDREKHPAEEMAKFISSVEEKVKELSVVLDTVKRVGFDARVRAWGREANKGSKH